jgi:hypothetical protein
MKWDGIGPKTECLLRVTWADDSKSEWMHFTWRDDDGDFDGESWSYTHEGYVNESSTISITKSCDGDVFDNVNGADFSVTHWARLPGGAS